MDQLIDILLHVVLLNLVKIMILTNVVLLLVAYTVWLERKAIAWMQNRNGPNRVGWQGLLQPIADGAKFILKEDLLPPGVNKPLFILAPLLAVALGLTPLAMIPFGGNITFPWFDHNLTTFKNITIPMQITDVNVAVILILAITSVGVYGITLAGWSSNSKYSLLGSLRASAQMISYELSLGLSLVGVLMVSGSLSLRTIVEHQDGGAWHWNLLRGGFQVLGFFLYLTASYAETNRIPFDLPEAETELVAGYHTEYSAMKFAMFFMAEYANMFTASSIATLLFLGGWHSPFGGYMFHGGIAEPMQDLFWFGAKMFCLIFLYIWIRGTLPRFRYDQLMNFGWKVLLPLSLVNIIITGGVLAFHWAK